MIKSIIECVTGGCLLIKNVSKLKKKNFSKSWFLENIEGCILFILAWLSSTADWTKTTAQ